LAWSPFEAGAVDDAAAKAYQCEPRNKGTEKFHTEPTNILITSSYTNTLRLTGRLALAPFAAAADDDAASKACQCEPRSNGTEKVHTDITNHTEQPTNIRITSSSTNTLTDWLIGLVAFRMGRGR
jgi:hypothetical protein